MNGIKPILLLLPVMMNACATLHAQSCNGSLGEPSARITFGTGAAPQVLSSKTSYQLSTSDCPSPGEYSLPYLTFGCADGAWHTLVADHTPGDVNGCFLMINTQQSGQFYSDYVSGLCGGIGYEFSAWVVNMVKPSTCDNNIDPNLSLSVETLSGATLGFGNSGAITETASPIWKKISIYFQLPTGVDAVKITVGNLSPGGCGNAFALDDIEFRPCGPSVNATIEPGGLNTINVCADDQKTIRLEGKYTMAYNNPKLQWQIQTQDQSGWVDIPGESTNTYTRPPSRSGNYAYRLALAEGANISSKSCRIYSNPVSITVEASPNTQLTNYVYGCYGGVVVLYAAGGSTYRWAGPNGFASNQQLVNIPNVKFTDAGKYKVWVTTNTGCTSSDSMQLIIWPASKAAVSNGATVCEGTSVSMNASGGLRYRWMPKDSLSNDTIPNPVARPSNSTVYKVAVTNQYGCSDTGRIEINIWKKPRADAGPDKKTRPGLIVQLDGSVKGSSIDYYWTPADYCNSPSSLRPNVNPPSTIIYTLHADSKVGCGSSTDQVKVVVYDKVIIPNAFSPNGDGINDTWFIEPLYLFPECLVEVYNRYGQIVYRSHGYDKPWDGTSNGHPLPIGTYYYMIDLRNRKPPFAGSLTILR